MVLRSRPFDPDAPTVAELSAGAIVVRDSDGHVLLLHEVDEDRWSLPKGHVERGESASTAAERETAEESGLSVDIGPEVAMVHYRYFDVARRVNVVKTVVYHLARSRSSSVTLEEIFDRHEWLTPEQARRRVRYASDRSAISGAIAQLRRSKSPGRRPRRRPRPGRARGRTRR